MALKVRNFFTTSIGLKVIMAVTGVVVFGFVFIHMIGNLQLYQGPEKINHYAQLLRKFPPLLWTARVGLLLSAILHVWSATVLTMQSWASRPVGYVCKKAVEADYASRTMRWGGPLIAIFILYHLMHLTWGTAHPNFDSQDVYANVVAGFSVWYVSAFYIVCMLALGLHLYHGLWSFFQTLGLAHPKYNNLRRVLSTVITLIIVGGNISFPVSVLTGLVKNDSATSSYQLRETSSTASPLVANK